MIPTLYYCYDAYCGWCYGFSPVIKKISETYQDRLVFDVISGGMLVSENPPHIGGMARYIAGAYKNVETLTGVEFGKDYLWHVLNPELSDWHPDSEKPAIALSVLKDLKPEQAVWFAADLQYSLYYEGRDLCDDEAYRHLTLKYGLDIIDFYARLKSPAYKEKAHYDFAICKQLQISGFPSVFLQTAEQKFYLIARGYTSYDDVKTRIDQVLAEATAAAVS
ncbi:MAG: DsbA family protein [Bacteroidetes bacterium]|nr:MAG: DsbA family protein [Bacteroidota bacterium]